MIATPPHSIRGAISPIRMVYRAATAARVSAAVPDVNYRY